MCLFSSPCPLKISEKPVEFRGHRKLLRNVTPGSTVACAVGSAVGSAVEAVEAVEAVGSAVEAVEVIGSAVEAVEAQLQQKLIHFDTLILIEQLLPLLFKISSV